MNKAHRDKIRRRLELAAPYFRDPELVAKMLQRVMRREGIELPKGEFHNSIEAVVRLLSVDVGELLDEWPEAKPQPHYVVTVEQAYAYHWDLGGAFTTPESAWALIDATNMPDAHVYECRGGSIVELKRESEVPA